MASETDIVNRALTKLGSGYITALSDNSKSARVMAGLFDTVRKAELSRRYWNFALARDALPLLGTSPAWGFANQYQLPNDFLKPVQIGEFYVVPGMSDYLSGDDSPYAIEGRAILTDFSAPLNIRYVRDMTDYTLFDPLFIEAFAAKLAYEACYAITQSNTGREQAMDDYKMALLEASRSNAIAKPPQGFPDNSWIMARV